MCMCVCGGGGGPTVPIGILKVPTSHVSATKQ